MFRGIWTPASLFFFAALLSVAAQPAAAQGAGLQCEYTRNVFPSRVRDVAYTQIDFRHPARSRIVYNADFARRYASCDGTCMVYVVGGHECTHASGVSNELRADCGGVKLMKKESKWSLPMKRSVERALYASEPDREHPAGPVRVRALEACDRANPGPAPAAPPKAPEPPPAVQPASAPVAQGEACYYPILGCYGTSAEANADRARLGGALSVLRTDDISGFRKGFYCITSQPGTQESAYSTVTNYRRRVPSAYVKKGC